MCKLLQASRWQWRINKKKRGPLTGWCELKKESPPEQRVSDISDTVFSNLLPLILMPGPGLLVQVLALNCLHSPELDFDFIFCLSTVHIYKNNLDCVGADPSSCLKIKTKNAFFGNPRCLPRASSHTAAWHYAHESPSLKKNPLRRNMPTSCPKKPSP